MKKRNLTIGAVAASALIALTAVGTVNARPQGHCESGFGGAHAGGSGDHMMGKRLRRMMHKLDLSEAQRDQIFEIMHERMPAAREKMKELRKGRDALHDAARAESYDSEQARALAEAQAAVLAELMVMRTETFNQIYGVLTPEQREKAAQWRKERHGRSRWH